MKILILTAFLFLNSAFSANPLFRAPPVVLKPIVLKQEYSRLTFNNRALHHLTNTKIANYYTDEGNKVLIISQLKPETARKVQILLNELSKFQVKFNPNTLKDVVDAYLNEVHWDLDALIALIMREVAKDVSADLKEMMDQVQKTNQNKNEQRDFQKVVNARLQLCARSPNCNGSTRSSLEKAVQAAKEKMDSLDEMSDIQQLKLQAYMDRYSKVMEILSNILKKISETASSIVSNIR